MSTMVRGRSLSAVSWVTVEKVTQQALWLALFAILAPLLGPGPYGVFSIAMVFVGFCEFVLGEGMAEVLVTVAEFGQSHATTTNLVGSTVGAGLGLLLAGLAPMIGALFENHDITRVMWVLAPLPLLSLLSAAPIALLRRGMLFKRLALRSIASIAVSGAIGIVLARAGAGVWALALQVLTQRMVEIAIAWAAVPLRFRFGWSSGHFRQMRPVGADIFGARVMMFAGGQMPRLILGYTLGPTQVGLFTLANRFLDIILLTMVFPRVAVGRIELRSMPPDGRMFASRFVAIVRDTLLVAAPLLLGAAVLMPDLYSLWLDPRWLAGVRPAQIILLSGLPMALVYCFDAAFLAARLPAVFRRTSIMQAASTTLTVACAAPYGLNVVCLALLIRAWVLLPIYLSWLRRRCGIAAWAVLLPPLPSLAGAVLMAAALYLPWWRPPGIDERLSFLAMIAVGVLCYGVFCYGFARQQLRAFLADFVPRRP